MEKAEEDEVLFSPVRGGLRYSDLSVFLNLIYNVKRYSLVVFDAGEEFQNA